MAERMVRTSLPVLVEISMDSLIDTNCLPRSSISVISEMSSTVLLPNLYNSLTTTPFIVELFLIWFMQALNDGRSL